MGAELAILAYALFVLALSVICAAISYAHFLEGEPAKNAHAGSREKDGAVISAASRLRSNWLSHGQLAFALAITPILLFPSPLRLTLIVPLVVIVMIRVLMSRTGLARTPLNVALLLLLVSAFGSTFTTFDITISLGKVSGLLLGVIWYMSLCRWLTTDARIKASVVCFIVGGSALAVIGTLGVNGVGKVAALGKIIADHFVAIRGISGAEQGFNPNPLAGTLVIFLPLQVTLLLSPVREWLLATLNSETWRRAAVATQGLLLLLTSATFSLMQSRGATLGLAIAITLFLVARSRAVRRIVLLGTTMFLALGFYLGWATFAKELIIRTGPGEAETRLFVAEHDLSVRMQIWSVAVQGIRDYPVMGMGMNAFRYVVPTRYALPREPTPIYPVHAHNNFLQTALDLGMFGVTAYLAIWLLIGAMLVRFRHPPSAAYRAIATALGIGLAAHFIFGITDAIPLGSKVGLFFWLALALLTALHRHAGTRPTDGPSA